MYFFCSETLVSSRRHISELVVLGLGIPMHLLRGEVDQFRELAVYERDYFSAYRQRGYECGYCYKVIVVRIDSSSHNFYVFVVYRNPEQSEIFFNCLLATMAQSVDRTCSPWIERRLFCLLAT